MKARPEPGRAERVVVYERTSGDEDQGQDAKAQTEQTVQRALEAGFEVCGKHTDEDVKGDTPWGKRRGFTAALRQVRDARAVLLVREPSRLWRGSPPRGLLAVEDGIQDLEVLGKAYWQRRGGQWTGDDGAPANELLRFIDLWTSWHDKKQAQARTILALADIKAGRRPTRSGRPLGRPRIEELVPDLERGLEAARGVVAAGGSLGEAREALRQALGYYEVTSDAARSRRDVSRTTLHRLLPRSGRPRGRPAGPPTHRGAGSRPRA